MKPLLLIHILQYVACMQSMVKKQVLLVNERMEERKDVEGLIKALKHGGLGARLMAAEALGKLGWKPARTHS